MNKRLVLKLVGLTVLILAFQLPQLAQGGWKDLLNKVVESKTATTAVSSGSLTSDEMVAGLKEALNVAVKQAVAALSQTGGYLDNVDVRIPLPDTLQTADKMARKVGLTQYSDQFIESMNRAAEKAAGETVEVFTQAITQMTFEDAKAILNGADNAATKYFEKTSTGELTTRIRPLVEEATASVGVTKAYKNYASKLSALGPLVSTDVSDLDGYVTTKAIDGLFVIMAEEEKKIREDPVARTTDLLKKVFGATN